MTEEAAALVIERRETFAQDLAKARVVLERLLHALATARSEAERTPGNPELAMVISTFESLRAALGERIATAVPAPPPARTPRAL